MNQQELEELAKWWWSLTPKERAIYRVRYLLKMETDPDFAAEVRRVLEEER